MSLYDKMGLLITPNGVAPSKIFAYKPTNGSGDGVFDRNTTATRVNSSGLIEDVAIDMARIDYPTNGSCPHLLFEPQSTNLITQSESFGKSYWTKTGASIQGDPSTAGVEEVVNGDFATDTWWGKDTSWTISGGSANSNGSGTMYKGSVLTIGKTYLVSFDISSYTSGSVSYPNGGFTPTLAVGSYSFTYMASSATVSFSGVSFIGSIDNVSVKEVQGFESPSLDSPTGAFKLVEDTSTGSKWVYTSPTVTSGQSYTYSVIAKKGGRDFLLLNAYSNGNNRNWFDLNTGTLGTSESGVSKIESIGNGWYRCSVTITTVLGTQFFIISPSISDNLPSYTGDGISGVYIYGAQLEALPYATSYIPTNGSAVTRVQDVATDFGDVNTFNSEEGVLFVEMAALSDDLTSRFISLSNGTNSNYVSLYYTTASNRIRVTIYDGVNIVTMDSNSNIITDFNKVAVKYKENDFALWVDGVEISTSTINFNPLPFNTLRFGHYNGSLPFYGKVKQLQVYKEALTDAELEYLTTYATFPDLANANNYNLILNT